MNIRVIKISWMLFNPCLENQSSLSLRKPAYCSTSLPHLILAGFATSTLATVATNISWSVTAMGESLNTTGSGDPMLTPSRCNRFAVSSSEGCSLPPSLVPSLPPTPISTFSLTSSSFPSFSSSSSTSSSPLLFHSCCDQTSYGTSLKSGATWQSVKCFALDVTIKMGVAKHKHAAAANKAVMGIRYLSLSHCDQC